MKDLTVMKKLGIALGVLLALILLAVLVLPLVVDANRYRGLIESKAEKALGRDVRLGEMNLSVFPALALAVDDVGIGALPEEGEGDLLTARSLRVGARLAPLLRGRLEVTSLVLEEPSMVLARDGEGQWNVERLLAGEATEEEGKTTTAGDDGELSIGRLAVSDGTLTYRDAAGEQPIEVVLSDLDLRLNDVSPAGAGSFELATSFAAAPETRLEIAGRGGRTGGDQQSQLEVHADVKVERMTGELLNRLAAATGFRLDGAVGDRPFAAAARLDMTTAATTLSGVVVEDVDLDLRRDADGRFNFSLPEAAEGTETETAFAARDVRLAGVRLRLRDAPRGRPPLDVVLESLDAELDGWPPERPSNFKLSARVGDGGSLEVTGTAGPGSAGPGLGSDLDLAMDVTGKDLPGSLMTALATAGGVTLDGALGERPIGVTARLEITGEKTAVTRLELRGADLDLRRDRSGRWNFTLPEGDDTADSPAVAVRDVVLDDLRLRLRDASVGERPLDAVLDDLRLELDQLPSTGPADFRMTARVAGDGGTGDLELSGRAGPAAAGGEMPLRLTARVGTLPLAIVQPMLDVLAGDGESAGRADLDLTANGSFPARLEVAGSARVSGARVTSGEPGQERLIPLDLDVRFDATVAGGGEDFDFRTLDVDLEGSTLSLTGTVAQEGEAKRWDMSLAPASLPADRLLALLALFAGDTGLSFSGSEPIELEARVRGSSAPGEAMDLSGRLAARDLRLAHPALTMPLERVTAEARLRGETVTINGFSARVGSNDLAGKMTVTGFATPRLSFDLEAGNADLGELLALAAEDTGTAAPAAQGDAEPLFAEGDLRIAAGTWDTLTFSNLTAHLRLEDDVATLEPAAMTLYGGGFSGRVVADLTAEPAAFTISGYAEGIDVDPFLSSNLDLGNLLFGRFTGEIEARGAGADYESILASLEGGGTARVDDGRLGRTDVLGAVAKVAGVLGQRSLASLAGRLKTQSTRLERLEGRFSLTGGKMQLAELLLDSPDFALSGKGLADLLSSALEGELRIAFSFFLSELMRLEGSRAAEVFWDPQSAKVAMPLALKGSFSSPTATVDWGAAVGSYARRRATESLLDVLGDVLGGGSSQPAEPAPDPPPPAGGARDLGAEFTGVRWGGSILFQDLKLEGVVRGFDVERATLRAADAGGDVIKRWDRLPAVDAYLANADPTAYAEIRWQARVDGKDLALARFPVTLTLTVHDRAGASAEATRTIEQ